MSTPRQHHYVPGLLLAGFTEDGTRSGSLHVVDSVRRTTYRSTPDKLAREKDYNLVEVEGVDPLLVETDLFANHIEGPAASALETIRRRGFPTEDERIRLLAFIAMQSLRSPSRRTAYDEFMTELARRIVELATESDAIFEAEKARHPELGELTRAEARALGEKLVVRHAPTDHLRAQLPSFGELVDLLACRSWVILEARDADFVCCDDPVVLLPSGTGRPDAPRGFASLDGQVLMPVGRRHALLGVWPPAGGASMWISGHADRRTVAAMNTGLVLIGARRFVASVKDDFEWLRGDRLANRAAYVELVKSRPHESGGDRDAL